MRGGFGERVAFAGRNDPIGRGQRVRIGDSNIRQRVIRVEVNRLLKILESPFKVGRRASAEVKAALEIKLLGLGVSRIGFGELLLVRAGVWF